MPGIACLALAVAPAASAQDDPTGGNEYTEDVPTPVEKPKPQPPSDDTEGSAPAPAPTTASSAPAAAPAAPPTTSTATGTLPRTGTDAWLIALSGGTLLGAGVVIRRRTAVRARP